MDLPSPDHLGREYHDVLERSITTKKCPLKAVQMRLEYQTQSPRVELRGDIPQWKLPIVVFTIKHTS